MKNESNEFQDELVSLFGIDKSKIEGIYFDKRLERFIRTNKEIIRSKRAIPVVLEGETGVGKSFIAEKIIHLLSPRSNDTFDKIDCSYWKDNEPLFISELFGHEKGSFTGASRLKAGRIELANNGSFCLENIEDMPRGLQDKLRLFLDDGGFYRVGGEEKQYADVRLIATHVKDIEELSIIEDAFSLQLFNRLNPVKFKVLPLRQRPKEIRYFIKLFIDKACKDNHKTINRISKEVIKFAQSFSWRVGNLRTLWQIVELAVIKSESSDIPLGLFLSSFNKKSEIDEIWTIYHKDFDGLNEKQKTILFEYKQGDIFTTTEICDRFDNISRTTAIEWLDDLVTKGYIKKLDEKTGKGGSHTYTLLQPYLQNMK